MMIVLVTQKDYGYPSSFPHNQHRTSGIGEILILYTVMIKERRSEDVSCCDRARTNPKLHLRRKKKSPNEMISRQI